MRRMIVRGRGERGAVAVMLAILLVVLMGFAGLAIDLGGAYSDRQQLQNGADAGALAIAESCARGACVDSADKYAKANSLSGQATGKVVGTMTAPVSVEVNYRRKNLFAAVLGMPTMDISARATASWGWPSGGKSFPLAFSWCAFRTATGGWDDQGKPLSEAITTVHLTESSCTPPAHNEVAGGFGWLDGTNCVANVSAGGRVGSDPGNDGSKTCKGYDWASVLQKKAVLVPIFEEKSGSGQSATYLIKGLASFTFTGYCFSSTARWKLDNCPNDKRIQGHFTSYTELSGSYKIDPKAPHFGAVVVNLTA